MSFGKYLKKAADKAGYAASAFFGAVGIAHLHEYVDYYGQCAVTHMGGVDDALVRLVGADYSSQLVEGTVEMGLLRRMDELDDICYAVGELPGLERIIGFATHFDSEIAGEAFSLYVNSVNSVFPYMRLDSHVALCLAIGAVAGMAFYAGGKMAVKSVIKKGKKLLSKKAA